MKSKLGISDEGFNRIARHVLGEDAEDRIRKVPLVILPFGAACVVFDDKEGAIQWFKISDEIPRESFRFYNMKKFLETIKDSTVGEVSDNEDAVYYFGDRKNIRDYFKAMSQLVDQSPDDHDEALTEAEGVLEAAEEALEAIEERAEVEGWTKEIVQLHDSAEEKVEEARRAIRDIKEEAKENSDD